MSAFILSHRGGIEESTAPTRTQAKSVKSVEGHAKARGWRRRLRSSRLAISPLGSICAKRLASKRRKLDIQTPS
jgi:hypothetical protein